MNTKPAGWFFSRPFRASGRGAKALIEPGPYLPAEFFLKGLGRGRRQPFEHPSGKPVPRCAQKFADGCGPDTSGTLPRSKRWSLLSRGVVPRRWPRVFSLGSSRCCRGRVKNPVAANRRASVGGRHWVDEVVRGRGLGGWYRSVPGPRGGKRRRTTDLTSCKGGLQDGGVATMAPTSWPRGAGLFCRLRKSDLCFFGCLFVLVCF